MPRLFSLAFGSATLGLAACGGADFGRAVLRPSEQSCVENAMRRGAEASTSRDAARRFEMACRDGDPAACSALGVAHEVGAGTPRDPLRARELFEGACGGGNVRGCVNLGRVLLAGDGVARDAARAEQLFSGACEVGDPSGCAQLGRLMMTTDEAHTRSAYVREVLEKACAGREHDACLDLGDALSQMNRSADALAAYTQACVAGAEEACRKMDRGVTREAGDATAGWRSR